MLLYALDPDAGFAQALATHLGVPTSPHEHRCFEDSEHKLRPLNDPRGQDVYEVHRFCGEPLHSPQDKLMQLLVFIATLREHGVARVLMQTLERPVGFPLGDKRRSAGVVSSENLVAGDVANGAHLFGERGLGSSKCAMDRRARTRARCAV